MSILECTNVVCIWPDSLVAPHDRFNLPFFNAVSRICNSLTALACPSFIQIQNTFANKSFEFSTIAPQLYDITSQLDQHAKQAHSPILGNDKIQLVMLTDLITQKDYHTFASLVEAQQNEGLESMTYLGSQAGKAIGIDLSLTLKAQFADISDRRVLEFAKLTLFNNIVAIEATTRLICSINGNFNGLPILVCQNSVYSQNIAIADYLGKIRVDYIFYEALAMELCRIKIYRNPIQDQLDRRSLMSSSLDFASPSLYYSYAQRYLQQRLAGNAAHSYSPKNKKHLVLNIEDVFPGCEKSIRYVYYGNSPDELQSISISSELLDMSDKLPSNGEPFSTEYENLRELITQARRMPDVCFFVRMHPRLGSDHRGLAASYSRGEYIETIAELKPPSNVVVIHPEDAIPSYWLGCWCHGVLSFRGTMPLEMNLLGYNPLIGSADLGLINSSINIHALQSRRTKAEWSHHLSRLDRCVSNQQMSQFVKDFYYSRHLGSLTIQESGGYLDALRTSIQEGSSLTSVRYRSKSTMRDDLVLLNQHLLWLQNFIYANITANQTAPVFAIISRHLHESSELIKSL